MRKKKETGKSIKKNLKTEEKNQSYTLLITKTEWNSYRYIVRGRDQRNHNGPINVKENSDQILTGKSIIYTVPK